VGRRLKWVIILGAIAAIATVVLMVGRSMVLDISKARHDKDVKKRRAEKNDGPL
jgi:hypothetical protein